MILLIDNYDSFVHTLARYVRELGGAPLVRRHDALTVDEIRTLAPTHVIISPGPCTPAEAGVSVEVVRELAGTVPILGVCLGHQCIGAAYGAAIVRARRPMHGKTSPIRHADAGLFRGLPNPFAATRYHSLAIDAGTLPTALRATAHADDGEIMAVEHVEHPVYGVQFHPESVLTKHGYRLIDRFIRGVGAADRALPATADALRDSAMPR